MVDISGMVIHVDLIGLASSVELAELSRIVIVVGLYISIGLRPLTKVSKVDAFIKSWRTIELPDAIRIFELNSITRPLGFSEVVGLARTVGLAGMIGLFDLTGPTEIDDVVELDR